MTNPQPGVLTRVREALPSYNFLFLLLIFCGTGAALWHGWIAGRFVIVVFVLSGWVVSLCLHEFGHAVTAYLGGDAAIARTGYLDLDPMRYSDPVLSILLPVVFVLLGGIGLPGGAVYVRTGMLRSRAWQAAVSAAGPLGNLVFLLILAALYASLSGVDGGDAAAANLAVGIGALAFFQATAIVLNLLPVPGLDGFGIIEPFLPRATQIKARELGNVAILILFALLWLTSAGAMLFRIGVELAAALGIDPLAIQLGLGMMRLF